LNFPHNNILSTDPLSFNGYHVSEVNYNWFLISYNKSLFTDNKKNCYRLNIIFMLNLFLYFLYFLFVFRLMPLIGADQIIII
jgi:hypothetical protein